MAWAQVQPDVAITTGHVKDIYTVFLDPDWECWYNDSVGFVFQDLCFYILGISLTFIQSDL